MKFRNILIYTIDILALIFLCLFINDIENNQDSIIAYNDSKQLNSSYITYIAQEDEPEEPMVINDNPVATTSTENTITEKPIVTITPKEEVKDPPTDNKVISDIGLETFTGKITGYGPDCSGCTSNKTASGYYVGEGNIYYSDKEYGSIRIVAGDKKYPFGTIVKLSNLTFSDPIIAIVLDRGSGIGLDKKIQFDLLFDSEKNVDIGIKSNVQFDILRLGY